jgi:hypothetical protein
MKKVILVAAMVMASTSAMAFQVPQSAVVDSISGATAGVALGSTGNGSAAAGTVVGATNSSTASVGTYGNTVHATTSSVSAVGGLTGSRTSGTAGAITGGVAGAQGVAAATGALTVHSIR